MSIFLPINELLWTVYTMWKYQHNFLIHQFLNLLYLLLGVPLNPEILRIHNMIIPLILELYTL